jgi:hypothetical protein
MSPLKFTEFDKHNFISEAVQGVTKVTYEVIDTYQKEPPYTVPNSVVLRFDILLNGNKITIWREKQTTEGTLEEDKKELSVVVNGLRTDLIKLLTQEKTRL